MPVAECSTSATGILFAGVGQADLNCCHIFFGCAICNRLHIPYEQSICSKKTVFAKSEDALNLIEHLEMRNCSLC